MAKGRSRSRAEWQSILDGLDKSGLTQTAYAKQVGCHPTTFGWWRRRLKKIETASLGPTGEATHGAPFVELQAGSVTSPDHRHSEIASVRVEGRNGTVITFATVPPAEYMATLLRHG